MESQKFEAIGQRGEACIVLLRQVTRPDAQVEASYSLATGERLRPTAEPGEFETLDGARKFKLRQ